LSSTANSLSVTKFDTVVASNVHSLLSGSMVYSESPSVAFTSINSLFECKDVDFTAPATGPTPEMGGAFYIKDAIGGFTSTMNTYRRCYLADIGGAFHLDNTKLIDTDSQISSN